MRRHGKMIVILAAVGVLALTAAAVALGAGPAKWRPAGGSGLCGSLMSNPKALKAIQDLRVEHQKDMQVWSDKYGADSSSFEAQAALQVLRQEHRNDMRGLFNKLGINVPQGARSGGGMMRGSGGCGGACGGAGTGSTSDSGYGGGMMGGSTY